MARVIGFKKLETLFRKSVGLDLDKSKADRIVDIVEKKFHDLLLVAVENCRFNGRNVIEERDLPITRGFEESLRKFRELKEVVELSDVLKFLEKIPPLKYSISSELEEKLPEYIGALILITGNILKEIGAERKPSTENIEKTNRILNLTL